MPSRDAYAVAGLAVLIFFVAFNLQAGWVYAVDALLLGLLITGFVSARASLRGVSAHRVLPSEAMEGETVSVALVLGARGRGWRFFVEALDAVPGLERSAVSVPLLRANQTSAAGYSTIAVRRGTHQVETLRLQSGGLTGWFTARRDVSAPGSITVYPRYWRLSRFPLMGWSPHADHSGAIRKRGGLEFHGLRGYRPGDSLRHVHWRSSARRGTLMVREFEEELPGTITLLLDTRPEVQAGGDEGSFEDLVRAAASIAWYATARGGAVRLLAAQGFGPLDVAGGWRHIGGVLADIQPTGIEAPAELAAAHASRVEGTLIVLTPDPFSLPALVRDGRRVVAIVAEAGSYRSPDGERFGGARVPPGIPACVIRKGEDIGESLERADGGGA